LFNLTPGVVLFLERVGAVLIGTNKAILFICKSHLAIELVCHRAQEDAREVVIVQVPTNFATVFELDLFEAATISGSGLEACINSHFTVTMHHKVAIGAFRELMAARWMMAGLLHHNLRAILSDYLVSLAENGIQWLFKSTVVYDPAIVAGHDQLHSLDWICGLGGTIHVDGEGCSEASHLHQHRLGCHDSNRETDLCQIEVATEEFFADHLSNK